MAMRPDIFRMNLSVPLARGLVFAGLGYAPRTFKYQDSSRYGNHGALTGYANDGGADSPPKQWQYVPQLGRWALGLDGSSNYVQIGSIWTTASPYSVSFWGNRDTISASFAYPFCGTTTYDNGLFVYEDGMVRIGDASSAFATYSGIWTDKTNWHHLAFVVPVPGASVSVEFFFDGISKGVVAAKPLTGILNNARFGCSSAATPTYYFPGQLTDTLVYRRALPLSEIQKLANPSNVNLSGAIVGVAQRNRVSMYVAGGGTAYTQSLTESMGLVDSTLRTAAYGRGLTESLGMADTTGRQATVIRALTEALGLTDSSTRIVGYDRDLTEAVGLADALTRAADYGRLLTDSVGLTDAISRIATFIRANTETLGLTDDLTAVRTLVQSLTEAIDRKSVV